jgi:hypothetical protein
MAIDDALRSKPWTSDARVSTFVHQPNSREGPNPVRVVKNQTKQAAQ